MSAAAIATLLLSLGAQLAKLADIPFDKVMKELAKRTKVDTSELDRAAKEQDEHLKD